MRAFLVHLITANDALYILTYPQFKLYIQCIPHIYVIIVIDIDGMATPQR